MVVYTYFHVRDVLRGSLIATSRYNDINLTVPQMSLQRGPTVRRLEMEPEVRNPRAAVVFMNRLYVTSTHDDTINVFEPVDKW